MLKKDGPVPNFRGYADKKLGWLVRCVWDVPAKGK
jgi:hypothetical protein